MEQQEILDKPATSKVAVYSPIEAGITLMLEKHGGVLTHPPVVTGNATALAAVKASRKELVTFRTTLEKTRVAEKAASLEYGKLVDAEAKRIQAFATPLEEAYDAIVTAEENRLDAIRQAELEAERQRIAVHRARIQAIKDVRETANMCRSAERIKQLIDGMPALFDGTFEEFQDEALTAFNEVCTVVQMLHDAKAEAETQAAELKRQRDELAAQQAEANRKAAIQARLVNIRGLLVRGASCATSVEIAHLLKEVGLIVVDESFAEFALEAEHTIEYVSEQLDAMHSAWFQAEQQVAKEQDQLDEMNRREKELQDRERPAFAAPALAAEPGQPVRRFASSHEIDRPDDEDIVVGLAEHFDATEAEVVAWLRDMNLDAMLGCLREVTS